MIFAFHEFELDAERLELRRAGKPIKADALVLRLLVALVRSAGQLVTKDELVDEVWEGRAVADNVLTVSMARLRKTLDHKRGTSEFVVNVYGRGYRFVQAVTVHTAATMSSSAAPRADDASPPFVGRERVVARLRHALSEASAGRGRVCLLTGEPGIGKTGAVEAFERELTPGQAHVAWGYCREAGDTPPLWPWLRLLRTVMAAAPSVDLNKGLGAAMTDLTALLGDAASDEAADNTAAGTEPTAFEGAARHQGFDAILRAFVLVAQSSPCVLVLDDLHRADSASLELLGLLLDEIARTRILVIATLRHTQGRRAPRRETLLPYVLGHRNCERIALARLRGEDVAAYVGALFDDLDGNLGRAVFAKSEGNPFFMAELSRQLRDTASPDSSALSVPDTALELVRQRVARLDVETREMLSAAAVVGRTFELPLLSAVTGDDPATLIASLDDALATEVVVPAPDSMTAFAFGHELLRVVLRDALSPTEQRHMHLRVGEALEQRRNAGDAVSASELAYHFHAALPDSSPRKTVDHCRAAATAAAAVFANADVVRYMRHALEALDLVHAPSARLRIGMLNQIAVYARGHAPRESAHALQQVLRLAREHGDAQALVHASGLLNPHPGFKPQPGAIASIEQALELLDPDDAATRSIAMATLSRAAPYTYSAERSQALIAEAERLARESGSQPALRGALATKLYLQGGPAHVQTRGELDAELERLAQENPTRMRVLPAELSLYRAMFAFQRGDVRNMNAALSRATLRCRELRHVELSWHGQRFSAMCRVNSGAWSDGVAALEALHRQAEQQVIFGTEPFCAFDRVVVFGELTETLTLDDAMRSALEFDAGDPPSLWSLSMRALASAGLVDEARASLRAVSPADLRHLPCDSYYLGTLGHLARTALSIDALDYAEVLYALLTPYPDYFAGHVSFLCEGSVSQLLGMLAHALGRRADAIAHFELGITSNERAGFEPRAAEARLQLARCLLDHGRPEDVARATTLAAYAEATASRLGMRRLAREAAALR